MGFPFLCSGQETTRQPLISVIARATPDSVMLRWAIDQPAFWKRANTYGYSIERFTISRKGTLLNPPERKMLTTNPIKPLPLERWQTAVQTNDYAAILAQALYGEDFEVAGTEQGTLLSIVNKSRELDQRFSFALFAADMNFEAATMAGLGYIDTTISTEETYFYKIKTAVPENFGKVTAGTIAVNPKKVNLLPAPIDLFVVEGDRNIMLSWEYELFKSIYTSYSVERSENGIDFTRLSDIPLVNLNDKPDAPAKRMYYIDTLSQNHKKYHYRIIGISPFGQEGTPSKVVSGAGKPNLTYNAHIKNYTLQADGSVILFWEFPKEGEQLIKGFALNSASKATGPYKVVVPDISPQKRQLTYTQLSASNYFTLTAIGKSNTMTTSLPVFVQPIDSTAPKAPTGLTGRIDSTGITKVTWIPNTESDLLGYRVFRANRKGEELVPLIDSPTTQNSFTDTLQVASLNSNVYYSVVALDQRYNTSAYSKILVLNKPDVIPPTSPIFTGYKIQDNTVHLRWIPSSSDDVVSYGLYRKDITIPNATWKRILQTKTATTYTDTQLLANHTYRYAIFATDKSGLQSKASTPVTLSIAMAKTNMKKVKAFGGSADKTAGTITLYWKNPSDTFESFIIYKTKNKGKPRRFREVPGKIRSLQDHTVTPNNTYTYTIKPVLPNGKYGHADSITLQF